MLKLKILAIDKIKNKNFKESFEEYLKRSSPYAMISVVELSGEPFSDKSNREKIKEKEGEKILNYFKKNPQAKIIILTESGKELDSIKFSEFLFQNETGEIIFVIGGSLGLSLAVLNYKNAIKMRLSAMTFPHELARVILIEQIYRAIAINKNKSYHY